MALRGELLTRLLAYSLPIVSHTLVLLENASISPLDGRKQLHEKGRTQDE